MQRNKVTIALTYENAHVSILVGLGDTPVQEPTHIWDAKTKELKWKFMEGLERRGKNTRAWIEAEFMPTDINLFTGKWSRAIVEWCDQVPVLGLKWPGYDLVKEHLA